MTHMRSVPCVDQARRHRSGGIGQSRLVKYHDMARSTLWSTNIAMGDPPFEDVFPIWKIIWDPTS